MSGATIQPKAVRAADLEPKIPTLGVVLLDCAHYAERSGRYGPADQRGLGFLPSGFYESPATWPVPTVFLVAEGAEPLPTLRGDGAAIDGLVAAVSSLGSQCDLIVTDCGFLWAARAHAQDRLQGTLLVSGLDLLDLAGIMTSRPIGVLTYSEEHAHQLLSAHLLKDQLEIVGMDTHPIWSGFNAPDFATAMGYAERPAQVHEAVRSEFVEVISQELRSGRLRDVGVLLLECTIMPQFRPDLRELTTLPILDAATVARRALA